MLILEWPWLLIVHPTILRCVWGDLNYFIWLSCMFDIKLTPNVVNILVLSPAMCVIIIHVLTPKHMLNILWVSIFMGITHITNPTTWFCRLCTLEKYHIMFEPEKATLNKRSEFFGHCWHKQPQLLVKQKWIKIYNYFLFQTIYISF